MGNCHTVCEDTWWCHRECRSAAATSNLALDFMFEGEIYTAPVVCSKVGAIWSAESNTCAIADDKITEDDCNTFAGTHEAGMCTLPVTSFNAICPTFDGIFDETSGTCTLNVSAHAKGIDSRTVQARAIDKEAHYDNSGHENKDIFAGAGMMFAIFMLAILVVAGAGYVRKLAIEKRREGPIAISNGACILIKDEETGMWSEGMSKMG
ncbi:hypothetical protein K504DRAFT_488983 [Pleomassaria siparia CBS 279.74]|uniref:Uncharacterized protein n=1 Tax=Pleomassaria siparia CBS 279.74 TaxID=1314801 RepID=A0A6G1KIC4_9PLEO|nr:hypothetical protein K504DRAFT_488983 [Pleomassaria siparia CBS 279.74]